jgi:nucleotide-binding universal stress UspA family protein
VAHRVARTARQPVMIVQPDDGEPRPIQRLVVPLDGSPLAERAMPVATAIARRRDLPAHLISVVDVADRLVPALDYAAAIGAQRLDELVAGCHAAAAQLVEGHGARLLRDGVTASWSIANGPAATTILESLAPSDLLILSSHGMSSVRRWHLGSVAEKLIQNGRAHVLLLPAPPDVVAAAEAGASQTAPAAGGRS